MSRDVIPPTVGPVVRSDLDTVKQALRDAIQWQNGLSDAFWNGIKPWERCEENRRRANAAIVQRNKYAAILKSLSAPNKGSSVSGPAAGTE